MKASAASARASRVKPRPAQRKYCAAHASVEKFVRERWEAFHGRTMRWDQRQALAAELAMYARLEKRKGAVIDLTLEQWCIELGLPIDGLSYREIDNRYGSRRRDHDDDLLELGLLEDRGIKMHEGTREPSHILVRIPGPVAQLVRAARSAPRFSRRPTCSQAPPQPPPVWSRDGDPGPDEPFFSGQVPEPSVLRSEFPLSRVQRDGCARATASRPPDVCAALEARLAETGTEGGARTVEALPWLPDVAPAVLGRAACRLSMPGFDLRLSAEWERKLNTAVEQLDRLYGRGAGAALILDLAGDGPGPDPALVDLFAYSVPGKPKLKDPMPRTLGAIAVAVRHYVRRRVADSEPRRRSQARRARAAG